MKKANYIYIRRDQEPNSDILRFEYVGMLGLYKSTDNIFDKNFVYFLVFPPDNLFFILVVVFGFLLP